VRFALVHCADTSYVVAWSGWLGLGGSGLVRGRHDVDDTASASRAELDIAGGQGEQRVVATATDVGAWVEVRAALANDDLTGVDELTAEALDAEALGVAVAAVACGGCALLCAMT